MKKDEVKVARANLILEYFVNIGLILIMIVGILNLTEVHITLEVSQLVQAVILFCILLIVGLLIYYFVFLFPKKRKCMLNELCEKEQELREKKIIYSKAPSKNINSEINTLKNEISELEKRLTQTKKRNENRIWVITIFVLFYAICLFVTK